MTSIDFLIQAIAAHVPASLSSLVSGFEFAIRFHPVLSGWHRRVPTSVSLRSGSSFLQHGIF